jgi:hypothetical protein
LLKKCLLKRLGHLKGGILISDDEPGFGDFVLTHIWLILMIGGSYVLWIAVDMAWPDFFDPWKYWLLTNDIGGALLKSWPLYVYAASLSTIIFFSGRKNSLGIVDDTVIFAGDIYKSVMAGILEEVGFRCFFIFTSMVVITVTNWLTWGLVLWLYGHLLIPAMHLVSFGMLDPVLYATPLLFTAAMLSANVKFRNGHKYQGLFGFINSWLIGFYLIYVMLTQGLLIAIGVHMIYDIIIGVIKYLRHA